MKQLRPIHSLISMVALAGLVLAFLITPAAPSDASPGKLIVGYAAGWSFHSRAKGAALDGAKFSHLIYAFLGVDPAANACTPTWTDANSGTTISNMADLVRGLKDNQAENPDLKVILSIGGAGAKEQFEQLTDYTAFAQSCYDLMVEVGADGLDVDYEFPETDANRSRLTSIMQALDNKLHPASGTQYSLTMAIAASDWYGRWLQVETIKSYVDHFNVMAFNYHGSWESALHYNSPSTGCSDSSGLCATSSAHYWHITRGVPKDQLVIGIGWYGSQYSTSAGCSSTPGATDYSSMKAINYSSMRTNGMLSGPDTPGADWTRGYDTTYQNAYLCKSDTWIGFQDAQSVKWRADWLKNNGYPGMMIWEVFKDYNSELLDAICNSFSCSGTVATPTPEPAPDTPSGFTATVMNANEIQLQWNASTYANSYDIYRCSGAGCTPALHKNTTATSYSDTSLQPETSYSYYVQASNESGASPATATLSKTTPSGSSTAPSAPSGVSASQGSVAGTINLKWDTSADATGYAIYRSTTSGFSVSPGSSAPHATTTDNVFNDSGLTGGTTYYYRVAAYNNDLYSSASSQVSAVAPRGQTDDSAYPAWDPNGKPYALGDRVSYQGGAYECTYAHTSQQSWNPEDATTLWSYLGPADQATPTPGTTPPDAPQNLGAAAQSSSEIELSWNAVTAASEYRIFRCTGSGCSPSTQIATIAADSSSPTYRDTGLQASTTFGYAVKAASSAGASAASASASATTLDSCSAPATPTGLATGTVSTTQIDVSWSSVSGATGYKLYRGTTSGFQPGGSNRIFSGSATSFSDTGLTEGTTYYYKIAASAGSCDSPPSGATSGTTQETASTVPTATPSDGGGAPDWASGVSYAIGDLVKYEGVVYECVQAHTSQNGWEPPNVPALWAK